MTRIGRYEMFDFQENPLPNLFPGSWKILKMATRVGSDIHPTWATILPPKVAGCGRLHYRLEMRGQIRRVVPSLTIDDHNSLSNCRDCGDQGDDQFCVSFWRHAYYDMIFGLKEDFKGKPLELWSAKRVSVGSEYPAPEKQVQGDWRIKLWKGWPAAKHSVRIKRLKEIEGQEAMRLKVLLREISQIPELDLEVETLRTSGFALYHLGPTCCLSGCPVLYDIIAYDGSVGSFNSVFGFRSLNYWGGGGTEGRRVFATFNSQVLRFMRKSFLHLSDGEQRFGEMMAFERLSAAGSEAGDSDTDDPDVGVWVGEHDG